MCKSGALVRASASHEKIPITAAVSRLQGHGRWGKRFLGFDEKEIEIQGHFLRKMNDLINVNIRDDVCARLSVVIPTYNYAKFLPRAIQSVLDQTKLPLEIIVADDGSTDNTQDVVKEFGDRIIYRRFDHQGVYSLRSNILKEVRGDWFFNLDADNWIDINYFDKAWDTIEEKEGDPSFAFCYSDIFRFGVLTGLHTVPEFNSMLLKKKNFLDMNCFIKTKIAQRIRFDPIFNSGQGDYDFFLTLAENGYYGKRFSGSLLHYRVHGQSITSTSWRQFKQREIIFRILSKHSHFFSREETQKAIQSANNRMLVALINCRTPFAGFGRRLMEWLLFARVGWRHSEFKRQTYYLLMPNRYFNQEKKSIDIFYLFRDIPERRDMVMGVINGGSSGLNGNQLFGFEDFWNKGFVVDCNLRYQRPPSVRSLIWNWLDRQVALRTGVGLGDVFSVHAHLKQINNAKVVVASTDNTGLPAARLKYRNHLKPPLIYISIGLPERIRKVQAKSFSLAKRYRERLASVDHIIAYGYAEAEWLKNWLDVDRKVHFIPFGVDIKKWTPANEVTHRFDVLSIGADPMRDFKLLFNYAAKKPESNICLVTNREYTSLFEKLPGNIRLKVEVDIEELKNLIISSRSIVLPIKENTYSGATTTLLQCMAMAKPVAVSRVGAIREGYGLEDKVNIRWMKPGSYISLESVIDSMLADDVGCKQLGIAARRHVEEHLSWNIYVSRLENCLSQRVDMRPKR